jgi:hypothetical protein
VWSALVIGTFAPDFEYFLRLAPNDGYGHTLKGTFLLTLPLAFVVLWMFHALVKAPVVELLPEGVRRRIPPNGFRFGGASRFAMIVTSILVGISTHLVWDSFTHSNTWIYRRWDALHLRIKMPGLGEMPLYKIFQHGSTAFGMGILFIWLLWWYRATEPHAVTHRRFSLTQRLIVVVGILSLAFIVAVARATIAAGLPAINGARVRFAGIWVTTLIALIWWQLVLYGLWRGRVQET